MRDPVQLAHEIGFSHAAVFDATNLRALDEVREMCRSDRCRRYNKSWSCPPACGTIEETTARMKAYQKGVLVQTTAELDDDFDVEHMAEAEKRHKAHFMTLARQLRLMLPDCLPLSAGSCNICQSCSYPEKPCRFPGKMLSSMEAYGLLVSEVCTMAGLKYYYGPKTLTYSSCVLWKEGKEP